MNTSRGSSSATCERCFFTDTKIKIIDVTFAHIKPKEIRLMQFISKKYTKQIPIEYDYGIRIRIRRKVVSNTTEKKS